MISAGHIIKHRGLNDQNKSSLPNSLFLRPRQKSDNKFRCYVPFMWQAFLCAVLGVFVISVGAFLCALGFYEESNQGNVESRARDPRERSSDSTPEFTSVYVYVGPGLLGIGCLCCVMSCVSVCETRDRLLQIMDDNEARGLPAKADLDRLDLCELFLRARYKVRKSTKSAPLYQEVTPRGQSQGQIRTKGQGQTRTKSQGQNSGQGQTASRRKRRKERRDTKLYERVNSPARKGYLDIEQSVYLLNQNKIEKQLNTGSAPQISNDTTHIYTIEGDAMDVRKVTEIESHSVIIIDNSTSDDDDDDVEIVNQGGDFNDGLPDNDQSKSYCSDVNSNIDENIRIIHPVSSVTQGIECNSVVPENLGLISKEFWDQSSTLSVSYPDIIEEEKMADVFGSSTEALHEPHYVIGYDNDHVITVELSNMTSLHNFNQGRTKENTKSIDESNYSKTSL